MYLSLPRATSRMLCPSVAVTYSPSMRMVTFCGKVAPPLVAHVTDVAAQASRGLLEGCGGAKAEGHLSEGVCPLCRGPLPRDVAAGFAGLLRWLHGVAERGPERVEPSHAHEALVHVAGGLLAEAHGVRDVGGSRDEVAPGVEALATGLEGVPIHLEHAALAHRQAGCSGEVGVDGFAHREDDAVAVEAYDLFGEDRPAPTRGVELAQAGLHCLDGDDVALLVPEDAVGGGEGGDLRSLVLGTLDLL